MIEPETTTCEPVQQQATPPLDAAPALPQRVEALLIASPRAVPAMRLAQALGMAPMPTPGAPAEAVQADAGGDGSGAPTGEQPPVTIHTRARRRAKNADRGPDPLAQLQAAVEQLNSEYAASGRSFRIEAVAGGYRFMTLPAFGSDIAALNGAGAAGRLSRSAMETLAIVAYRQPVTRATLEAIRGVSCGETLKTLMERRLITIAGRAEELGRPMLYATTRQFLELFGLSSLKDLPAAGDLRVKG
jgi:segregation and condensation protein B